MKECTNINTNKIVVILGNDHTNTLGLVQSMGPVGFQTFVYAWGVRTGIVKSSKYLTRFTGLKDVEACIQAIVEDFKGCQTNYRIPILCSCDGAALAVEKYSEILSQRFVFEHCYGDYSISSLCEKDLQVRLAAKAGFNTPHSYELGQNYFLDKKSLFSPPYIYKALKSVEGDKGDLTICQSFEELQKKVDKTLKKTPRVLIQQYIERDYEISILGCSLSDGTCLIPALENKLTLYPKNVGLECLAYVEALKNAEIIKCINNLLSEIKYIGLFSVEMMHCKNDGKFYFTEINLRNDGANSFILKYGINLPAFHVQDITGITIDNKESTCKTPGFYIWEMHHFYSLLKKELSFKDWYSEIKKSKGGLVFSFKDLKPFLRQFTFPLTNKLKITKGGNY